MNKEISESDESSATENLTLVDRLYILIGEESVSSFARRAGISDSLLRKYLNGTQPGAENIGAIAKACGCTIDWIVTGEQPMFRSGIISYDLDPAGNPSEVISLVKSYISANEEEREAYRLLRVAIDQRGAMAWLKVGKAIGNFASTFHPRHKKP